MLRNRWMPQAWPAAACRLLTTDHCMWSCRIWWFSYQLQLHEIKQQLVYIIRAHSKCRACLACDQQPFKACEFDSHWDKTSCRGAFRIYLRVNRTSCRSIAHFPDQYLICVNKSLTYEAPQVLGSLFGDVVSVHICVCVALLLHLCVCE